MVKDRADGPAAGDAGATLATGPRVGVGAAAGGAEPEAGAAGVRGAEAGAAAPRGAEGRAAVASRGGPRFAVSLILSVIALAAFSAGEFRHTSPSVAAITSSE